MILTDICFILRIRAALLPHLKEGDSCGNPVELNGRFNHLEGRGVGGCVRAPGLAEDGGDFGDGADELVGLLEHRRGLGRGDARQGRWHVEDVALGDLRQEFATDALERLRDGEEQCEGGDERRLREPEHPREKRLIDRDEEAVEGVLLLGRDLPADPEAHQHGHEHHGEERRSGHRPGLRPGERPEEPPLLAFEREDRNEGERDDEEREEERRPHLDRGVRDEPPAGLARERFARVCELPVLDLLVGVLNHHDCGVHHRAHGDRDAAEAHQVRVDALEVHRDEGEAEPERERDDRDEGAPDVPEEERADERHHGEPLEELAREGVDCLVDQRAAVVDGDDLDPLGGSASIPRCAPSPSRARLGRCRPSG